MAKDDEHFLLGIEHGANDAPIYRWQDRDHQERYDAGYLCGQALRVGEKRTTDDLGWADFCRRMQRRGYDRVR